MYAGSARDAFTYRLQPIQWVAFIEFLFLLFHVFHTTTMIAVILLVNVLGRHIRSRLFPPKRTTHCISLCRVPHPDQLPTNRLRIPDTIHARMPPFPPQQTHKHTQINHQRSTATSPTKSFIHGPEHTHSLDIIVYHETRRIILVYTIDYTHRRRLASPLTTAIHTHMIDIIAYHETRTYVLVYTT